MRSRPCALFADLIIIDNPFLITPHQCNFQTHLLEKTQTLALWIFKKCRWLSDAGYLPQKKITIVDAHYLLKRPVKRRNKKPKKEPLRWHQLKRVSSGSLALKP